MLRTTLLGVAARRRPLQPRPRRRAGRAVRVGRAYLRRGGAAPTGALGGRVRRASGRRRPYEPHRIAGARRRARCAPPAGAASRGRPTSTRSRACSRRSPRSSAPSSTVEPGERAVPASRAARRGSCVGGRGGGLDRRAPPAGLPRLGPRGARPAFELDLAPLVAASPIGARALRGRDHLSRPSTRTSRWSSPRTSRPRAVRDAVARRRRRAAALGRGLRPLPRRAGRRGRKSLALRLEFRAARPHPDRRGGRRAPRARSSEALGGDRGVAP